MISAFDYHDFRAFLADWFAAQKAESHSFTYREFSRRAGRSNPSMLLNVIRDRRNITADLLPGFVQALGLEGLEAEAFRLLVAFGQSKDREARERAWAALVEHRAQSRGPSVDVAELKALSRWFYTAVRELAVCRDFRPDPVWISQRIVPEISVADAEEALAVLVEVGLLAYEDGRFVTRDPLRATSAFVRAHATAPFHVQHHQIAADLLDRLWTERDPELGRQTMFIGSTAAIPAHRLAELRQLVWAEQLKIMAQCDEWAAEGADHVVHVRLSLFPLTRWSTSEK